MSKITYGALDKSIAAGVMYDGVEYITVPTSMLTLY